MPIVRPPYNSASIGKASALLIWACLATPAAAEPTFDWIVGHWCTQDSVTVTEEIWLPKYGQTLLGMGRTRNANSTVSFEYLRITGDIGEISLVAQPGGRPPTHFLLTRSTENSATFENPEHDFPQRIAYERRGQNLLATVAGADGNGFQVHYTICDR